MLRSRRSDKGSSCYFKDLRNSSRSPSMRPLFFISFLFVLCSCSSPKKKEASVPLPLEWDHSIVHIEISGRQFDYFQPWSKRVENVKKMGVVVEGHTILTTAD